MFLFLDSSMTMNVFPTEYRVDKYREIFAGGGGGKADQLQGNGYANV